MLIAHPSTSGVQEGARKPPAGTNANDRVDALLDKWAKARQLATTPKYKDQVRGQGSDLPASIEGPMIDKTMYEVAYYLNPDGWEYCTVNQWLNGTPSEDDLGIGSSVKKQFTAQTLEMDPPNGCGDHSYGDQYEDAINALIEAGAPAKLTAFIKEHGRAKHTLKARIFKDDAESNIKKGAKDAFSEIMKYVYIAAGLYVLVTFGPSIASMLKKK